MKKLIFGLLLMASAPVLFSSCKDDDKDPAPAVISTPLFFPMLTADSDSSFNLLRTRASENSNTVRPVLKFTIDIPDQRDVKIKAVQVYKSYRAGTASALGPRALAGEYTTFPATVTLNSQEVLTDLFSYTPPTAPATVGTVRVLKNPNPALQNTNVFSGASVLFTFEYVLEDGQHIILTPLSHISARLLGTPTTTPGTSYDVVTGTMLNAPYSLTININNQ